MDIKHVLKEHAYLNIPLSYEEAYELGEYALAGCRGDVTAQIQSITALSALHTKATYAWNRESAGHVSHQHELPASAAEQIAGVCAAIFERDIAVSENGFLRPNVPYAMDNAGMGGDLVVTANVSTIAALIAASAGIPMCKHGSPSNADKGRHGSSDFISLLGIDPNVPKEVMEKCVEETGFGYIEALDPRYKHIHAQTHETDATKKKDVLTAGIPHMNDIIGPVTSPLCPSILTRRVVGLNQLIPARVVAEAYRILNGKGITRLKHGFFIRGFADAEHRQGIDEVSICEGGTQVAELRDGEIREFVLTAEDFGITPVSPESISPPPGMSKGDFSLRILRGEVEGPPLQMILANASLLFVLADRAASWKQGFEMASQIYRAGLLGKINDVHKSLGS